ncbi:heavy-metal-associated domain-containing protein [Pseudorhodobacter aquimaris]|uniref:heavy-metal-associated domain-containing protein n=1 Tax=Pseudorhodobacter aquimaris TaxID=687412 RepID=UPI00067E4DB0|nr:heavy-metal-associated domain-containing protein [Pseudorhodobacter aquimaris]
MTKLHVPDMSCGHCKATVAKTIHALDPEARVDFDMDARQITVNSGSRMAAIQAALEVAGYPTTPI